MIPDRAAEQLFAGAGEMAARLRSIDWSQTAFGAVETWPQSLRSTLGICLNSRFPIAIYWGKDNLLLYNDAWRPIVGDKHPWAIARPAREVWAEIWDEIGAELAGVLATGDGTFHKDDLLSMHRFGYTEECFFEYTFNPIHGQNGVDGILNIVSETTYRVLGDRRAQLLREVASQTGVAKTVEAACAQMIAVCQTAPLDIPFALLYLIDPDGNHARLCGSTHPTFEALSPATIDLTVASDRDWPIATAIRTAQPQTVFDLASRGTIPGSPWPEPPQEAMVLPIATAGQGKVAGVLVAVASPRRRLDENYCDFFTQLTGQIALAIANARSYEAERQRAEELAELDRAKTVFFSNVSHEFRTPLMLMLSPLEDLSSRLDGRLQADESEQFQLVQRNGLRLQKLVNTLLDFSRIEAGRMQAVYEPIDLAAFTIDLASVFRSLIERANLTLTIDCPPLPEPVYVDRDLWEKVVLNLLSNAFKFTFEGGITVRLRAIDGTAELSVADTGVGIAESELPRLFERFHRISGTRSRSHEGSGIGLAFVQELVKLHGGTVQVSSQLHVGTTFSIALPFGTAHLPPDRIQSACTLESTAIGSAPFVEEALRWQVEEGLGIRDWGLGNSQESPLTSNPPLIPRILLADDNADMRDYVQRLLGSRFEVQTVENGAAAIEAITTQLPDLVLSDVMMPIVDGFELLRRLRSNPATQEIPIILLSARAGEEARIEGLAAGADDYLIKPFSARELLARVEAVLKLAKLRQESGQREQRLRLEAEAAQQQVERVLSSINDGFYVLDRSWRFTYVNDRYCQMVEMPRSDLLGHVIWDLFPDAIDTEAYRYFHQAVRDQTPLQFEYRYAPWDCWHDHRIYPSANGLTVLIADITVAKHLEADRKRAEAALQKSEERLSLAIDSAGMATWDVDMRSGRGVWSPSHYEMLGYPPAPSGEVTVDLWHRRIHPDDRAAVIQAVEQARQTKALYSPEYRIIRADTGEVRWLKAFGRFVGDAKADRFIGVLFDTSDRKQAEIALRKSEEQLRLASEGGNFGLWYWDMQTDTLTWSTRAKLMFGLPAETEMSMQVFVEAIHPDDRVFVQSIVTELEANQPHTEIEYRTLWPDGTVRWILARGNCDYDADGTLIATRGILLDVTDRKRAELNDRFLNQLDARLRQLPTAEAMAAEVVSSVGEYLKVDLCLWHEVDCDRRLTIVNHTWQRGTIPNLTGIYDLEAFFTPNQLELFAAGQPVIVSNVTTHPDTAPYTENYLALNVQAFISVPCLNAGRWVASLAIDTETTRNWRSDEVVLLQEIVARLWSLIERQRAIQELRRSEAEFRQLANAMPQIVWVADAEGALEFVNDRWTDYTGLTLEQSRDRRLVERLIPPEDNQQLSADFGQAQAARSPYQSQFRLIQPNGSYLYFLTRAIPIFDAQGQVCHWYGTSTDTTGLKQLEDELRQKSAILSVISESSPAPIFVKDREGRIIFANPATLEVLGKSAAEVIGYRDCDLYPNPADAAFVMENDRRIMETGQMEVVEESPDGIRTFLGMKVPYRNEAGDVIGLIGISNDITDRVQLERDRERILQQEQEARSAAEAANRIKDEFLAVLSHELRSPLNPILGWSKLLQQGKLDAAKTQAALATIERNAQLQSQLINDLLDISRILRGKLSLEVVPVDLRSVILAALETVDLSAKAKSLHLEIDLAPNLTVQGDAGRLQQIVWNLLSNAVKFTPNGGRIEVRLAGVRDQGLGVGEQPLPNPQPLTPNPSARLTISDTGKGINPKFLPYVFEHFRQEDGTTTRKFGGLGLGLAIARQLVELHGGQIWAESAGEGQGATFIVQLPLAIAPDKRPAATAPATDAADLNRLHILVVDDELDSREFAAFVLEQSGAIVRRAESGLEALQVIAQFAPDLIVSDIGMPDMDGYMLIRQIRALNLGQQLPAIALTAYAGEYDQRQAIAAGFQQHLSKPVDPDRLIGAIQSLCDR